MGAAGRSALNQNSMSTLSSLLHYKNHYLCGSGSGTDDECVDFFGLLCLPSGAFLPRFLAIRWQTRSRRWHRRQGPSGVWESGQHRVYGVREYRLDSSIETMLTLNVLHSAQLLNAQVCVSYYCTWWALTSIWPDLILRQDWPPCEGASLLHAYESVVIRSVSSEFKIVSRILWGNYSYIYRSIR